MLTGGSGLSGKISCNAVPPGSMSVCLSMSVPSVPGMTLSRYKVPLCRYRLRRQYDGNPRSDA